MPDDLIRNLAFDSSILDQLACPACLRELRVETNSLHCAGCGRRYPIVDGIPVLIGDRAEPSAMKQNS